MPIGNRGKALLVSALLALAGIWLMVNLLASPAGVPVQTPPPSPTPQAEFSLPDYREISVAQPTAAGVDLGDLLGVLWKTALVIVLLYISLRGLRWLQRRNLQSSPIPIAVLASAPLEPGKRLLVVEVAGRVLVLATAGSSVTLLTELASSRHPDQTNFQTLLKNRTDSMDGSEPSS